MNFDIKDIREVQAVRPKLSDQQADEVLGFLSDAYDEQPYTMDNPQLFGAAADLMFGGNNG